MSSPANLATAWWKGISSWSRCTPQHLNILQLFAVDAVAVHQITSDHLQLQLQPVAANASMDLLSPVLEVLCLATNLEPQRATASYSKLQQATACSLLQPAAQQSVAFSWPSHGGVLRPRSPRLSRLTPRCEGTNVLSATGTAKTSKEYKDLSGALWVKMSDSQSFTVWFCRW